MLKILVKFSAVDDIIVDFFFFEQRQAMSIIRREFAEAHAGCVSLFVLGHSLQSWSFPYEKKNVYRDSI